MERNELLGTIARKIAALPLPHPLRVAIDGVDGAGKTTFANELAPVLRGLGRRVIQASIDGFHNPRDVRYARGRRSAEGFFRDSYDLAAVRRLLLVPLGPGGTRQVRTAAFDWRTDAPVDAALEDVPEHAILLFDGIFLQRPELDPHWDMRIFVDVTRAVSLERNLARHIAERGAGDLDSVREDFHARYRPGQELYLASCDPRSRADVVVDNNVLERPMITRGG